MSNESFTVYFFMNVGVEKLNILVVGEPAML